MSLPTRTLGEICDEVGGIIQTGPFGSQLHESDYRDTGTPVIMPKDMVEGKVSVESIARIGDEDVARLARHKLGKGDIVYARRGDIGRHALVTEREVGWLCGTGCLRISLGHSVVHPQFLHYYLGQDHVVAWVFNQAVGATLPNLNTSIVRSIPITYPPLTAQRKIAGILSAYDDLIENNTRRIAILEEMARLVYREWFVEFRFPGHEGMGMVESAMGPIPEGWEGVELKRVAKVNAASIERGKEPKEIEYIDIASVSVGSVDEVRRLSFDEAPSRARRIVRHGDIIWSSVRPNRKSFALILNPPPDLIVSTGFAVITSEYVPYTYLYQALTTEDFVSYLTNHATGSAYPAVNAGDFERAVILQPTRVLLESYHSLAKDMLDERQNLFARNRILRQTRDLLLPRLISGEVDVSELPIETGGLDA